MSDVCTHTVCVPQARVCDLYVHVCMKEYEVCTCGICVYVPVGMCVCDV